MRVFTSSLSSSVSQPTFTLFPKLPEDLRFIIWNYAIRNDYQDPRILELAYIEPRYWTPGLPIPHLLWQTPSSLPSRAVPLSMVNKESLSVVKNHYTFWKVLDKYFLTNTMLFLPRDDVLFFRDWTRLALYDIKFRAPARARRTEKLVIQVKAEPDKPSISEIIVETLEVFRHVKILIVIKNCNEIEDQVDLYMGKSVMHGVAYEWKPPHFWADVKQILSVRVDNDQSSAAGQGRVMLVKALEAPKSLERLALRDLFPHRSSHDWIPFYKVYLPHRQRN